MWALSTVRPILALATHDRYAALLRFRANNGFKRERNGNPTITERFRRRTRFLDPARSRWSGPSVRQDKATVARRGNAATLPTALAPADDRSGRPWLADARLDRLAGTTVRPNSSPAGEVKLRTLAWSRSGTLSKILVAVCEKGRRPKRVETSAVHEPSFEIAAEPAASGVAA